jgi:hypothetical protein
VWTVLVLLVLKQLRGNLHLFLTCQADVPLEIAALLRTLHVLNNQHLFLTAMDTALPVSFSLKECAHEPRNS